MLVFPQISVISQGGGGGVQAEKSNTNGVHKRDDRVVISVPQ